MKLIDREKLENLIRVWDIGFVSKKVFLDAMEECEVNIKSPEEIKQAIKHFDHPVENVEELLYPIQVANFGRWILNIEQYPLRFGGKLHRPIWTDEELLGEKTLPENRMNKAI